MAYINAALIEIYLLEKERGNSGRNRTIKKISSYETITLKRRRGGGEKRERENGSGYSVITAVASYNFAVVKSK